MNIIAKIGTYTLFLYTLEYNHRLPASDFLDTCLFCSATGDRRTDLTDRRKKMRRSVNPCRLIIM